MKWEIKFDQIKEYCSNQVIKPTGQIKQMPGTNKRTWHFYKKMYL